MDNISQDEEKLLKLLEELEEEYHAGNISDDKYKYLSKQYGDRLSDIDAVARIRAMQGKKVVEKQVIYSSKKEIAEKSKEEDEELIDKYVVKTEEEARESKAYNKRIFALISIVCLIAAFSAGIGFGIFNFDFQFTDSVVVTVNESAFPIINSNSTNKTSHNNTNDNGNSTNKSNSNPKKNNNIKKNPNKNTKPDSNKQNSNKQNSNKQNSKNKPDSNRR